MTNKLFYGLLDRLINLLDESEQLFFSERPYLLDPEMKVVTTHNPAISQNELEIQKTLSHLIPIVDQKLSSIQKTQLPIAF